MKQKEPDNKELTEEDNKEISILATHLYAVNCAGEAVKTQQEEVPLWNDLPSERKEQYLMDAFLLHRAGWRLTK